MLYSKVRTISVILGCIIFIPRVSFCDEPTQAVTETFQSVEVVTFKPDFSPPSEILNFLGATGTGSWNIIEWQEEDGWHSVEARVNAPANLFVISGFKPDIDHVLRLIKQADISPRQIEIEVKIVEVRKSLARDLGIDWEGLLDRSRAHWNYDHSDRTTVSTTTTKHQTESEQERFGADVSLSPLSAFIKILDESGAGTIRTAPRVLTINNRRASILDGERVTYITRYSSYTNLFETDSMDAGLTLSVLPSLGESGYITLNITAELTSLQPHPEVYCGSPIKQGQMIENTVVVKDGESVLLGGRTRTIEEKSRKRFPLLGHILPFLFSREVTMHEEVQSFVVITPRVVDFNSAIDAETRGIIEGQ